MDASNGHLGLFCGRVAVEAALSEPFNEPMRALLDYWRARCGRRCVMPRAELLPEELPALLPHLFLLDRVEAGVEGEPPDWAFRLVGTAIARIEGELTGTLLSELIPRAGNEVLWEHYERVLEGELCLRRQTLVWQGRDYIHYEVLLLPMTRSGEGIDSLLGMALYRYSDPGATPVDYPVGPMA